MKVYQWSGAKGVPHKSLEMASTERIRLSEIVCYSDIAVNKIDGLNPAKYTTQDWIGLHSNEDISNSILTKINTPVIEDCIITLDSDILSELKDLLSRNGEILPLPIEGEESSYYIFHPTKRANDFLDESRSLISSNADGITDIKKFSFRVDYKEVPEIFKIGRLRDGSRTLAETFVTDDAYDLLKSSGADGWSFKLIWDSGDIDYIDERYRKSVWDRINEVYRKSQGHGKV